MTNSYYDEPLEQNDYEAEQNAFYAYEATIAPPTKQDIWPQRSLSRFLGTMLWGATLFGLVVGTIWWFDILPVYQQQKPEIITDDFLEKIQITPSKTKAEEKLSNPFADNSKENNTPFNEQGKPPQSQTVAQAAFKLDTPQKKAHRKRQLPAPNELLTSRTTTNQQWSEGNSFPPHSAEPISPPKIILTSGEKRAELINPPQQLSMPEERKPAPPQKVKINLSPIDALLQAGKDLEAHRELSKIYWERPEARPQIMKQLEATAKAIFISRQKHYTTPYVVEQGDQLAQISQNYYVPWQYLARLNRTSPRSIRPGQKLKVIKGPLAAVIDLSDYELTIHAHGYFVKRYKIGVGKEETTPLGTFKVLNKLENPTYYGSDGVVMEADDPDNPLGERWIDLGDSYGIHGTINPQSIGKAMSKGCIRMLNKDVEEVFDFLGVGSMVKIQK